MKILIIDDSEFFRGLLRKYLSREIQDLEIDEYEVESRGKPGTDFPWPDYDILLLDYNLGQGMDGLDWLEEYGSARGFPPTIVLTGEGDEYVAVRAIKLGAVDYFNKDDIHRRRLADLVMKTSQFEPDTVINENLFVSESTQIIKRIQSEELPSVQPPQLDYKAVRMIGKGGMSKVFLAERKSDGKSLVLKILELDDIDDFILVKRFIQEAELIARVDSDHVVKIYEYGFVSAYGFIAMELFTRGDLKERLEVGVSLENAIIYIQHIAAGLREIHKLGIVHRDLKPANIMFRGDDTLAIGDFGISKQLDKSNPLTQTNYIIGTPHYMSPEQGEGLAVDTRSDIYSTGVIFFQLLTGKYPFDASSPSSLIYKHNFAKIPDLPEGLTQYQEIINRLLAKKPEERYQTIDEFISALNTVG